MMMMIIISDGDEGNSDGADDGNYDDAENGEDEEHQDEER